MARLAALLRRTPLPVLLTAPVLLALVGLVLEGSGGFWWLCLALVGVLLISLELSRQTRQRAGQGVVLWSREFNTVARRVAGAERHRAMVEQQSERRRGMVSPETSKTFRLFTQLVRAEEATRAQMAAELHDAVAQTLSRALVELRAEEPRAALSSLVDAEHQLRAVMARLRPPELVDGDLATAVADLAHDVDSRYGVQVEVSWPAESLPLPVVLATTLYRFVQEALTNAVVHADGIGVRLDVAVHGAELHVAVTDAGPGFDPAAVVSTDGRHVGLRLARERARLAGGVIDIESSPGAGTCVRLRLPLSAADEPDVGRSDHSAAR